MYILLHSLLSQFQKNHYKQLNDILIYESQNNDPLYIARFITYEQGLTEFNIDDIYFFEYIKKRYVKICSKSGDYHLMKNRKYRY